MLPCKTTHRHKQKADKRPLLVLLLLKYIARALNPGLQPLSWILQARWSHNQQASNNWRHYNFLLRCRKQTLSNGAENAWDSRNVNSEGRQTELCPKT